MRLKENITYHSGMPKPAEARAPVFIVGIAQRSGTHFLYDLLVRHPDCRPARAATSWEGSWEDHLLDYSHLLSRYADLVATSNRLNRPDTRARLMRSLGLGLTDFVEGLDGVVDDPRRPVTKTPVAAGLERFPELFPGSIAVLITRDPRAVVASALRTFGGRPDDWIWAWREGARAFVGLLETHPESCALVRYEQLYANPAAVLSQLLAQLGLARDTYDFAGIRHMPVRGSSELGGAPQAINWLPARPDGGFDPLQRGSALPKRVHERIIWCALPEMQALGYAPADEDQLGGLQAQLHVAWSALTVAGRVARSLRGELGEVRARRDRRRANRPQPVRGRFGRSDESR